MEKTRKITFADLFDKIKNIKESDKIKYTIKTFGYLPAFLGYGTSLIVLLKLSQIVLGWNF